MYLSSPYSYLDFLSVPAQKTPHFKQARTVIGHTGGSVSQELQVIYLILAYVAEFLTSITFMMRLVTSTR